MKNPLLPLLTLLLTACGTPQSGHQNFEPVSLYERRSADAVANDRDIEAEIYEDLNDDDALQTQTHVNANVYNGAVLVTGEAATPELRNKIITLIRVIDNVNRVNNNIAIAYPSDVHNRAKDVQMTRNITAVLTQIRTLPNFDSSQVKVVTENAVVYLMGLVHREEGSLVVNVVRHQPDVKKIITVFEYLD
ncbi:MAG: BON domain-containing protein [Methylovulum sp.]|nr:BON domain-containing protein [Methylovulum sp.]